MSSSQNFLVYVLIADKLLHLVESCQSDVFIVFCNTVPSCDWTARFLVRNGVPVVKLHAGFSSQVSKSVVIALTANIIGIACV